MTDKESSANAYEDGLPQTPANYTPLSPLSFLERTAGVYPEHTAVIHGDRLCASYCADVTVVCVDAP